jgi:hypothetical protein
VSARDAKSGRVSSVYCRFCVSFGGEVGEGRKRRATENRKFFQKPFRTDNYVSHLRGYHREKGLVWVGAQSIRSCAFAVNRDIGLIVHQYPADYDSGVTTSYEFL